MTLDLTALGAAAALVADNQGPRWAGGAGAQVTSHPSTSTLALTATASRPPSKILVGFSLRRAGRSLRRTLGAAFSWQVSKIRSLWALHLSALGPLAEDLTPAAGAEVTARAVPHVTVVVHRALVQAAPLGGSAFVTALTWALYLGVALVAGDGPTGLCVAFRLTSFTHTCGARVFLPLIAVLVLFPSRQAGVGHTPGTALARWDHQVFILFAGDWLTLCNCTLDLAVSTHTSGAEGRLPMLAVPVHTALPQTRISVAGALGAAPACRGERSLVGGAGQGRARASTTRHGASGADAVGAWRRAPLAVVSMHDSLVLAGTVGRGDALRAALVGRDPQALPLLKVALWVGAAGRPADGDVAVAGTLLTGVWSP